MNSNLKRGLFLVTLAGVISISGETAKAADSDKDTEAALPNVGIEAVLNDCYASDEKINVESYLVPTEKGEYSDMAFTNVGTDTFLFVQYVVMFMKEKLLRLNVQSVTHRLKNSKSRQEKDLGLQSTL